MREMKTSDYDPICKIEIRRLNDDIYVLEYRNLGEEYELTANFPEIIDELSEHLDNMKTLKDANG